MGSFRFITTTLSMMLGLGVTRGMSGLVALLKVPGALRRQWLVVTWVIAVLINQLQFWWAIIELDGALKSWSLPQFVLITLLPLSLYFAVAMLLPDSSDEQAHETDRSEQRETRMGLVALAAYGALALCCNVVFFREPVLDWRALFPVAETVLPLAYVSLSNRRARIVITLGYLVTILLAVTFLSRWSY